MNEGGASSGRIVVVGNLKGGTGKSTVAVNLACAMRGDGKRVALLDADPQGTAADWISRGGLPVWSVHLPVTVLAETERWLQMLQQMRNEHDIVLVDLPAVVAPVLAMAFLYANLIIIPAAPNAVDLMGTKRVLRYIAAARAERPYSPPKVLIVPTRVYGAAVDERTIKAAFEALGEPVGPPLHLRSEHDQAFARGEWVGSAFPGSEAHRDMLAVIDSVTAALTGAPRLSEVARPARPEVVEPPPVRPRVEIVARNEALVASDDISKRRRPVIAAAPVMAQPWWRRLLGSRA